MIEITQVVAGSYNLFSSYSKDVIGLTAQDLLAIAEYVEQHREELSKEASDAEQGE